MMMQVFGLFFLLVAVSLGVMSAVCIITFRREDAERERRMSFSGFLKRPHAYLRKPYGALTWGFGILAILCALIGGVMLLLHLMNQAG
jgi:hypothetical protein